MQIIDEHNRTPNILHFHGQNINELPKTFETILNQYQVNANYDRDQLAIVSTWTNEENCCLLHQCKDFGIPLINCVPDDYDRSQQWYMPNKIHFFINTLKNLKQKYVLFLDGYDVLLTDLSNIIERFESQKYRILFGPSCNNYPDIFIDRLYQRRQRSIYRYFNAGCVMGYREDLLRFYEQSLQFINIDNPWSSEQFILRHVFARYSNDPEQDFVDIDSDSLIFRSMGVTNSTLHEDGNIYFVVNRDIVKHNIYVGLDQRSTKTDIYITKKQVDAIQNLCLFLDESIRIDDQVENVFIMCKINNKQKDKIKHMCGAWGINLIDNYTTKEELN